LTGETSVFVVGAGELLGALRIGDVAEIMRPLPTRTVGDAPDFVAGLAIVRDRPTPVVDLCRLLGTERSSPVTRFVSLRVGERRVALAVTRVVGIRRIAPEAMRDAPPLVRAGSSGCIDALGTLDDQLLAVLAAGRILTAETWRALEAVEAPGVKA
jgi:purine-binding chemotaxis protein CheW